MIDEEKELKEYTKIQKIFNVILLYIKDIISIFKHGHSLAFDTNFLIIKSNDRLDSRYSFFSLFNKKIVTEIVVDEKRSSLSSGEYKEVHLINNPIVLSFEEMRKENPHLCPLYYNFISWMHNPAVFMSEDFHLNSILREIMTNDLESSNKSVTDKFVNRLQKQRSILRDLDSCDEEWNLMSKAGIKALKKKRKAVRNKAKNYLNDSKTVSLCMLYLLQKKRNITIYTSDSDFIHLVFNFFGAFSNEWAFKALILEKIEKDKIDFNTSKVELELKASDINKKMEGLLEDTYADNWKYNYLIFKIKYWDQCKGKYFTFTFRLNDILQRLLLNSWGNYFCPFSKSLDMGNWLGYKWYEPEPRLIVEGIDNVKVRVEVWKKYNMPTYSFVDQKTHEKYCLYPKKDKQNDLTFFSQFADERGVI